MHRPSNKTTSSSGFTLVEMLVAVALFTIVMLVAISSLISMLAASKKAQTVQTVVDNLNITIDSMARSIRIGTMYHCGSAPYTTLADCVNGDTTFAFLPAGKTDRTVLRFVAASGGTPGHIERSTDTGATWMTITAPTVNITQVKFFVAGVTQRDEVQPKVILDIQGTMGITGAKTSSTFHVQALAVQRLLDL